MHIEIYSFTFFSCHEIIFLKLFAVLLQYLLNCLCYHLAWKPENSINVFPLLNEWKREILVLDICKDTKPHPDVYDFRAYFSKAPPFASQFELYFQVFKCLNLPGKKTGDVISTLLNQSACFTVPSRRHLRLRGSVLIQSRKLNCSQFHNSPANQHVILSLCVLNY